MKLVDLSGSGMDRLTDEAAKIRIALEGIKTALEALIVLPPVPTPPDHPIGASAVGSYANALDSLEGEAADAIRERLRATGVSDAEVEATIVRFMVEEGE